MKVTLLVPVLNEIGGMKVIMPQIPKNLFEQILVVDGESTDGSAQWARDNGYEVYVQKQKGGRSAYRESWPLIRGDYVLTFSPDGNCKTEDLPVLLAKLREGYDMVIASRYLGEAKSEDDDALTGLGNWLFTGTINLFFRAKYTDAMTMYRVYPKNLFYDLDLDKDESYAMERLFSTTIGVEPLLSIRAAKQRLRIAEIPSDEPKRIYGERKLRVFRWGAAYLLQIVRETWYWRKPVNQSKTPSGAWQDGRA